VRAWLSFLLFAVTALQLSVCGSVAAAELSDLHKKVEEAIGASRYAEAAELAGKAVALAKEVHGLDSAELGEALAALAKAERRQGKLRESKRDFDAAIDLLRRSAGPKDPRTAVAMTGRGVLYRALGEKDSAESELIEALKIAEAARGPDHPEVAEALTSLALVRYDQGRYADVESLLQRSLAIREAAFGPESSEVGTNLHGLGEAYRAWGGHTAEAERYLKQSLEVREKALGPVHYDVGESLHNVALFYSGRGDDEAAEPYLRRSLSIFEKVLGPKHPDVAHVASSLAGILSRLGRLNDSLVLQQRSLDIRLETLGPDHMLIAHSLHGLGWLYIRYGRYGDAEKQFRRALTLREENYGERHKYVAWDCRSLAWSLALQGRRDEAEQLLKRAIDIADHKGIDVVLAASSFSTLGSVYVSEGRYDEAVPLLQRALDLREGEYGPNHKFVAESLVQLAEVYRLLGRAEEAEQLFLRALSIRKAEITEVPVLFATDRKRDRGAKTVAFSGERSERMSFGHASVIVPRSAPGADAESALVQFEPETTNLSRLAIRKVNLVPDGWHLADLARDRLRRSSIFRSQVYVFVHGYNVSFENAVRRAAQIAYDLSFDSAPFLFSWPSRDSMWSYWYDRESAALAASHLKAFLEDVVVGTGAKRIHLIAHSMGNQVLLDALEKIALSSAGSGRRWPLAEIVMHAPDVDRDRFNQLIKATRHLGMNVTLYASANDKALSVSSWISGLIGRAGALPVIVNGVETIDITAAGSSFLGLNHDVYVTNPKIFDDMRRLLEKGTHPPNVRTPDFRVVPTDKGTYWVFGAPQ
jgi:esterase/lipase superfamily enzyme/tetratricopeptide (TPR) repeat protein